jgi:hypothetical protein
MLAINREVYSKMVYSPAMQWRGRGALITAIFAMLAVLCGCGGSADAGGEDYASLLRGLKAAALSGSAYDAVEQAEDLEPVPRASIDAFCETNRDMLVNGEAWKASNAGYYLSRIKVRAERELPFVSTNPVSLAVKRYRRLFELDSFDTAAVRSYAKACY